MTSQAVVQDRSQDIKDLVDPALVERLAKICDNAIRYFNGELHGAERLPVKGGALLVSNHAFLAIDSVVMAPLVYRKTGRLPRGLAEKLFFKSRRVGRVLYRVGAVPGTRKNAVELLRAGELCLCYPGGARESLKAPEDNYRLCWERAMGYLKVAIMAEVPIIPIVGVGVDEAFRAIGRDRFFTRRIMGHKRYDLPIVVGPFRAKFDFHVGEPWMPPGGRDLLDDPEQLVEEHHKFWTRAQGLLDAKREARAALIASASTETSSRGATARSRSSLAA